MLLRLHQAHAEVTRLIVFDEEVDCRSKGAMQDEDHDICGKVMQFPLPPFWTYFTPRNPKTWLFGNNQQLFCEGGEAEKFIATVFRGEEAECDAKKTQHKKLRSIQNSLRGCIVFGINAARGVLVRTCFNVNHCSTKFTIINAHVD